jgi:predicted regulator of Ras-like GTPase activity (Roadblock/LC7/MglB family)
MLKKYLTSLLQSVNGCSAILVYDTHKESNPIFRVGELSENETNAIKQNIGVFNSSIERAEKLSKTSNSKTIMAFYNHHQLFIVSKGTIVFIVVATEEANAGSILNLRSYLEPLVAELQSASSLVDSTATSSFPGSVPNSSSTNFAYSNTSSSSSSNMAASQSTTARK